MFCAGVTGVLLIFARGFVPEFDALAQDLFGIVPPVPMPEPNLRTFLAAWPYSVAGLWVIFVLAGAIWSVREARNARDERPRKASWKRRVGWVLLLIFVISTALLIGGSTPPTAYQIFGVQFSLIVWLSNVVIGNILLVLWSRGPMRPLAVLLVGALGVGVAAVIVGNDNTLGDGLFYSQILWVMAGILMFIASFFALRSKIFSVAKFKEFAFQIAARTRIAAGVLALLSAVAYFGITLWTIPVESKTRAMMQRQLQIGEVAWLREQMAAKN